MRRAAGALVLLLSIGSKTAEAQSGDPAAAAELFRQGREALQDRRYDEACPKFAESLRLDPKVGTLINLAQCEEATGKLTAALRHWSDAQTLAHSTGDRREAFATQQYDALAGRLPHVVLHLAAETPREVRVTLDGADIAPSDLGAPLAVDVGAHVLIVKAEGHIDSRIEVTTREGMSADVPLSVGPVVAPRPLDREPSAGAPPAPISPAPTVPLKAAGSALPWIAYGLGGAGIVTVGLGVVWGLQAIRAKSEPGCRSGTCDNGAEAQVQRDGVAAGNRSTIAFIAGGVLVAGGVTLWLATPRAASSPRAGVALGMVPGATALVLHGAW